MAANFNNSAWFYDRLSRLVYGRALIEAQIYLLQFIPSNSKILIIGGGTGWILEEITSIYSYGLEITYAEVARKMISRAENRDTGKNKVCFINDAVENIKLPGDFDVVITPFLFDNFTEKTLQKIFGHINKRLKPGGIWLTTSFQLTGKWWQWFLLKSMFLFFKILCSIEASRLPGIKGCFEKYGYQAISQQFFFDDFIISQIYKLQNLS